MVFLVSGATRAAGRVFACGLLMLAATFAGTAAAQAVDAPQVPSAADCVARQTALQADMDIARSRGRMLQRRRLADELLEVQARCGTLPPAQSREAQIDALSREIQDLRKELDRAESELRRLRQP